MVIQEVVLMENNEGGLELYEKKFETLKEQLFNRKSHNLRTFVIRSLINCGIGLDYALPFIIATFIIGCASFDDENVPFIRDEIVDYASVEMIDTSLGFHSEKVSYDYDYDDLSFEHSTAWKIGDEGLYERTITTYVTEGIDFSDVDKIFSMTKDEIADKFFVSNIKTIKKNELDEEDKMFDDDSFTIVQHKDSETEYVVRKERTSENLLNSGKFIIIALVGGAILTFQKRLFLKTRIKDKLNGEKEKYNYVDEKELDKYKKVYEIREENIALLSEECEVPNYQLRKK